MRIQLHSKRIQTSLGEVFFQTLEAQLGGKVAIVIAICLPRSEDQPVNEPVPDEHSSQRIEKKTETKQAVPLADPECGANCSQEIDVHGRHQQAREEMGQNSPGELSGGNGNPPVGPKNERRGYTPRPPQSERKKQRAVPVAIARGEIGQGKHTAENRPGQSRNGNLARTSFHPWFVSYRFHH